MSTTNAATFACRISHPDAPAKIAGRQKPKRLLQEKRGSHALARRTRPGRRTPSPGLEDFGIPSAPETKIRRARYGQKHRRHWRAPAACYSGSKAPQKADKAVNSSGRPYQICGPTPPTAYPKFRFHRRNRPRHAPRFHWEFGPFELWDAAGVEATVAA